MITRKKVKDEPPRTCITCAKQHTMDCPNSILCFSDRKKPDWRAKKPENNEYLRMGRMNK